MVSDAQLLEAFESVPAEDLIGRLRAVVAVQDDCEQQASFQQRVQPWMMDCFGEAIARDGKERNHRFLEEAVELVQACGCTASEAHQLVDYVYGRPVGEKVQEAGGVMVTLAALCLAQDMDMHEAGETELARIWTKVAEIRAKQAAKPAHSPLPEATSPTAQVTQEEWRELVIGFEALVRGVKSPARSRALDAQAAKARALLAAPAPEQQQKQVELTDDMVVRGAEVLHDSLRAVGCIHDFDHDRNGTLRQQEVVENVFRAMLDVHEANQQRGAA